MDHFLTSAKAYIAAIGAGVTAMVALDPNIPHWIVLAGVFCTGVATHSVPQKQAVPSVGDAPFVPDLVSSADPAPDAPDATAS